ncbi:helix-turn-helix transcriptional regulator [Porphyromonas bennonis]|uniref:helix-turn-helix transcriptional regulator n=1 Tax=Porphyromonas bennonis TaxID=501496 RepID=UPI0003600D87|nr:helix-turn-helix transcriptional regulator [Porphyromonas bennonis]
MQVINRIKVVLAEQRRTNKWLAEQLGKSENTISKWCSNKAQPSIETLVEIAEVMDVEVRTLICPSKIDKE